MEWRVSKRVTLPGTSVRMWAAMLLELPEAPLWFGATSTCLPFCILFGSVRRCPTWPLELRTVSGGGKQRWTLTILSLLPIFYQRGPRGTRSPPCAHFTNPEIQIRYSFVVSTQSPERSVIESSLPYARSVFDSDFFMPGRGRQKWSEKSQKESQTHASTARGCLDQSSQCLYPGPPAYS